MPETVIEVDRLVKEYNSRQPVLDGISFSIEEGEFVTVYGRSGSGKTTLLNILGGLDRPTSGEVVIDGQNIVGLSEDELAAIRLRKIGFVFQDFNLLMDLTVRDNVALPLRLAGQRNNSKVNDLLQKFEIDRIADVTANRISGGEAQRTAIARALMNDPKIILADEPTGNLDSENTKNVIDTFRVAINDYGATVVLATHDIELADYSSLKIMLAEGKAGIRGSTR
jgi:putative ABC transport system ATP-binding protein